MTSSLRTTTGERPTRPFVVRRIVGTLVLVLLAGLSACGGGQERVLARAAGHELTVDEIVEILLRQDGLPNEPSVVAGLATFWVDYMLLAVAAQEDPELSGVSLDALLDTQFEQEMIESYMLSIVQPDTVLTEDELREEWNRAPPADSVRARHILLTYPAVATVAQSDSVMRVALQLLQRARAGESFAALAEQYSEDEGSAGQGGDLGFFGPGTMVPPFEVSDPVPTTFGLHLIQVVDRTSTAFESAKDLFRNDVIIQRSISADSTFLAELDREERISVNAGAEGVLRELASSPRTARGGRAMGRVLVSYADGSFTVADALEFLQTRQADFTAQVSQAPDEILTGLLQELGQTRVLASRAEESGFRATEEHRDSVYDLTLGRVIEATDVLGIRNIVPVEDETADEALDRTVAQILRELLAGTRELIPMGQVTYGLRGEMDWAIVDGSVTAAVTRIDELKGLAAQVSPQAPLAPPLQPVSSPSDSSGN